MQSPPPRFCTEPVSRRRRRSEKERSPEPRRRRLGCSIAPAAAPPADQKPSRLADARSSPAPADPLPRSRASRRLPRTRPAARPPRAHCATPASAGRSFRANPRAPRADARGSLFAAQETAAAAPTPPSSRDPSGQSHSAFGDRTTSRRKRWY
eukprot:scaffold7831_cov108-Isochrysis_galbana.AAC.8